MDAAGQYACTKEETHAQALMCVASMQNCIIMLYCMDLYCTGYLKSEVRVAPDAVHILLEKRAPCACRQALARRCQHE